MSTPPGPPAWLSASCPSCACGKVIYLSLAHARKAAKRLHPGDHLGAYSCPTVKHGWHIGHLPSRVLAGSASRDDITNAPERINR